VSLLDPIVRHYRRLGWTIADAGIASAERVLMVLTSQNASAQWRAEITEHLKQEFPNEPERQWLYGVDTGASAMAILSTFAPHLEPECCQYTRGTCVPRDPDDWGRCHRLLELFPEWRARLEKVVTKFPAWASYVMEWPTLTAMYLRELPTGKCPELAARLTLLSALAAADMPKGEVKP
jgi:hypothetical protein